MTIPESQTKHTLPCQPCTENMVLTSQRVEKYMMSMSDDVVFAMCQHVECGGILTAAIIKHQLCPHLPSLKPEHSQYQA